MADIYTRSPLPPHAPARDVTVVALASAALSADRSFGRQADMLIKALNLRGYRVVKTRPANFDGFHDERDEVVEIIDEWTP